MLKSTILKVEIYSVALENRLRLLEAAYATKSKHHIIDAYQQLVSQLIKGAYEDDYENYKRYGQLLEKCNNILYEKE